MKRLFAISLIAGTCLLLCACVGYHRESEFNPDTGEDIVRREKAYVQFPGGGTYKFYDSEDGGLCFVPSLGKHGDEKPEMLKKIRLKFRSGDPLATQNLRLSIVKEQ